MANIPAATPAAPAASPASVREPTQPAAPATPSTPAVPTSALDPAAPPTAAPAVPAAPAQTWPDDWREQLVGADEKLVKRMQRYASPRDVANALIATQNRISAGELRSALKPNASEDEVKAWRAENGIPEAPDKYDLKMPNGIVFGEDDKPFIDNYLKHAHGHNMHPDHVKANLEWYYKDREAQIATIAAKDSEQRDATRDELVAEWGVNDFKRNSNQILSLLDTAPEGVKDFIMTARGVDDQALFNNANVLRFFDSLARQINPVATVVPGATGNISAAIGDELASLEKQMGNKRSPYWDTSTPTARTTSEKLQARYRELVGARERMSGQKAGSGPV